MTGDEQQDTEAGARVWESAQRLFYQEGIRSVGVAQIAATSNVGKPSLYRRFESKDALAVAYIEAQGVALQEVRDEARRARPDDPKAQLLHMIEATADGMIVPGYRGCPVANAALEFPDRDHPVRVAADVWKAAHLASLTALVADLGVADPDGLAFALHLLIEGAHVAQQIFPDGPSGTVLVDAASRLIESHLLAPPPPTHRSMIGSP